MKSENNSNNVAIAETIEALLRTAEEHDWDINWRTADEIAEIGELAVLRLIEVLANEDGYVRNAAAIALGKIGDRRAVEPLITAMRYRDEGTYEDDEDNEARMSAATALGKIADPNSYAPLIETFQDALEKDVSLAWYIIDALGMLGDKRAIPILEEAVAHADIDVRKTAASALKRIRERQ
jgi:HEAT repeat protein